MQGAAQESLPQWKRRRKKGESDRQPSAGTFSLPTEYSPLTVGMINVLCWAGPSQTYIPQRLTPQAQARRGKSRSENFQMISLPFPFWWHEKEVHFAPEVS